MIDYFNTTIRDAKIATKTRRLNVRATRIRSRLKKRRTPHVLCLTSCTRRRPRFSAVGTRRDRTRGCPRRTSRRRNRRRRRPCTRRPRAGRRPGLSVRHAAVQPTTSMPTACYESRSFMEIQDRPRRGFCSRTTKDTMLAVFRQACPLPPHARRAAPTSRSRDKKYALTHPTGISPASTVGT